MPIIFKEYMSKHNENHLKHEGDVVNAREQYYKHKPTNLHFLLKKRYEWMNNYIKKGDKVIEVGCGTGISKDFIRNDCDLMLTDFADNPWLDKKVDALDTKLPDNCFDAVVCSNMIHHVPFPKKFLTEMARIIKPNGYLLIQDAHCSLMTKLMLRLLRHEGFSFKVDVYSLEKPSNDEKDLWSANTAIPNLLFDDEAKFKEQAPVFEIKHQSCSEFFIFLLSGGVIAKAKTVNLPESALKIVDAIDKFLIFLAPDIFALERRIVLKKKE